MVTKMDWYAILTEKYGLDSTRVKVILLSVS